MSLSNYTTNQGQIPCSLTTCSSSGGGSGGGVNTIAQGVGIFVNEPTPGSGNFIISNGGVVTLFEGSGIDITPGLPGEFTITNTGIGAVTGLTQGSGIVIAETPAGSGNYTITNGGVLSILEGPGITITETPAGSQAFTISSSGGGFTPAYCQFVSETAQPETRPIQPGVGYPITHETEIHAVGITSPDGGTTFNLPAAGTYRIVSCATIVGLNGTNNACNLYLVSNADGPVTYSTASMSVDTNHPLRLVLDYVYSTDTNDDWIKIFFCSDGDADIELLQSIGDNPKTPSIITNIERIA